MRTFDTATTTALAGRGGFRARLLFHVWATRRATGAIEALGLWTGEQDRVFTIDGQTRTYVRAQGILAVDEIVAQPGTDVIMTQLTLASIDPGVAALMRDYEPRFAPVEIHRALFSTSTSALIGAPHRLFKGWIDKAPIPTPEIGGSAEMRVTLASANRALTRTMAFRKSDGALSLARAGDRFRRYQDVTGVTVPWGEKKVRGAKSGDGSRTDPFAGFRERLGR
jgi:hypothetical protein